MKNLERKKELLISGLYDKYIGIRKIYFLARKLEWMYDYQYYLMNENDFKLCEQLRHNFQRQMSRLNKRIESWTKNNKAIYWITFTFNDDSLNKSYNTRRSYISRMLNKNTYDYAATIDYGTLNRREHYHSFIVFNDDESITYNKHHLLTTNWLKDYSCKYGYYKVKKVRNNWLDLLRLKRYFIKKKRFSLLYKPSNIMYKRRTQKWPHIK